MGRSRFVILLLIFLPVLSWAQEVFVNSVDTPMNEVLVDLRDRYDVQFSFDDQLLSELLVTVSDTFPSAEAALREIISGHPLEYEVIGNVFVIYGREKKTEKTFYTLTGQVRDARSGESLPFSHLSINGRMMITDLKGSFSYTSEEDTSFHARVSHLGYYILDTLLNPGKENAVWLMPSSIGLKEVIITNKEVDRSTQVGQKAGLMKLNHQVARYLPGYGDNSVFNLLRLMPGITASGEQTNDLIIWGSYAGQSQVLFDGFPVYGLKNFNDNISAFNPLMAKDIEVHKGGYDTRFGERAGGVVNITGVNGNMESPSFSFVANNMTLNGMVEVPLFRKSSLVVAFRHTYYDLYNPSDMDFLLKRNNDRDTTNDVDVNIVPDYTFRDINIKYSLRPRDNELFYISLYGGNDRFSYSVNEPYRVWNLMKDTRESNAQNGGSVFYGRTWTNGVISNLTLAFTGLKAEYEDDLRLKHNNFNYLVQTTDKSVKNDLNEVVLKLENSFPLNRNHTLETTAGYYYDEVYLKEDTFNVVMVDIGEYSRRVFISAQDIMALGEKTILKAGMRATYLFNLNRAFLEPRISLSFQAGDHWKLNAGWGIYDQFITKSSVVDELGNFRYIWTMADHDEIPVIRASHLVLGTAFHKNGWTFSFEPFFKTMEGITRYFRAPLLQWEGILAGNGRVRGVDIFVQKVLRGHSAWVSYTLSKAEERFPDLPDDRYRRAPQDQRHEIKTALLLNFDPFYFSTNYVYGSGFPFAPFPYNQEGEDLTYSRWDISFIYKFLDRKVVGEAGLSIINVLNTQNIKYTNFERIPSNQNNSINIYAEAIPFTPALYLKLSL